MLDMAPPVMPSVGLCETCRHAREVVSGKGSRFVLCELSRTDRGFPRYPQLPVLACIGWEAASPLGGERR
jgi:hypothetical protein